MSITSSEFGGTSYFDQTVSFTASGCTSNAGGFNVCNETGSFSGVSLAGGQYWLNLATASSTLAIRFTGIWTAVRHSPLELPGNSSL